MYDTRLKFKSSRHAIEKSCYDVSNITAQEAFHCSNVHLEKIKMVCTVSVTAKIFGNPVSFYYRIRKRVKQTETMKKMFTTF